MLLTQKRNGVIKGRLAYNGKPTQIWIDREDKSSPTVLPKCLFLTFAIDAYKGRDVMSLDITKAFIQTGIPQKEKGKRIIMKIRRKIVNWLVDLDSTTYLNLVVADRAVKKAYVEILRAVSSMLEASLLWYRKFCSNLEKVGFDFNDYDPCVAYKIEHGYQHTIRFHVDNVLSSHKDPNIND